MTAFRGLVGLMVLLATSLAARPSGGPMLSQEAANRLLVIGPRAFQPALHEFVRYKHTRLPTEWRSLEDILKSTEGVDDPEKLKRFLYSEWRGRGLGYVLLVGDVDVMPVRYMVLDRVTPAAFDYAFYPSDLYYADLAKADGSFEDWNAHKEGFHANYFGEVRGEKNKTDPINFDAVHYLPEIAVGRWPVSTPDQVALIAAKTITYEQGIAASAPAKAPRAGFIATGGWVDSRPLLDQLAGKLAGAWQWEKLYYADGGQPPTTPTPDHAQVRRLLNDGVDLLIHTGHGAPDGWDQCFSQGDLDRLTNAPRLPVIMSAGCSTAHFATLPPYEPYVDTAGQEHIGSDQGEVFSAPPPPPSPYQRGRFNPTGLGEEFLRHSRNGSVAYIGCNTGSQPCGLALVEGFVTSLAQAKQPRLGDCWNGAIRHYFEHEHLATLKPNDDWYPPSIFFQGMKFMLFGDPSLRLP